VARWWRATKFALHKLLYGGSKSPGLGRGFLFGNWPAIGTETAGLTKPSLSRSRVVLTPCIKNKKGTMFSLCSTLKEATMLRIFVEEAAALASITLFVGMVAVWAQLISQF
jgi:hypothetical protein